MERAKPGAVDASFKWHRYSPKRTEPPKALIDRHHASRDQKNNAVISLERTHNGPKRWTSGAVQVPELAAAAVGRYLYLSPIDLELESSSGR